MTIPPATGVAPPDSTVPEPRAVIARPCRLAIFAIADTSSVLLGRTTAKGSTFVRWSDSSWRSSMLWSGENVAQSAPTTARSSSRGLVVFISMTSYLRECWRHTFRNDRAVFYRWARCAPVIEECHTDKQKSRSSFQEQPDPERLPS